MSDGVECWTKRNGREFMKVVRNGKIRFRSTVYLRWLMEAGIRKAAFSKLMSHAVKNEAVCYYNRS